MFTVIYIANFHSAKMRILFFRRSKIKSDVFEDEITVDIAQVVAKSIMKRTRGLKGGRMMMCEKRAKNKGLGVIGCKISQLCKIHYL